MAFADFVHDIKNSRYFQVWLGLWVVIAIPAIIGVVNIGQQVTPPALWGGKAFVLFEEVHPHLDYPLIRLEVFNDSHIKFGQVACATAAGDVVEMQSCADRPNKAYCQLANAGKHAATGASNNLQCLVYSEPVSNLPRNETNFVVIISIPDNTLPSDKIYVEPSDKVDVFITKIEYNTNHATATGEAANPIKRFGMRWAYATTLVSADALEVNFVWDSFTSQHWYAIDASFTSWLAFGVVGGMGYALYLFHKLTIGLLGCGLLTNDSRLLSGSVGSPVYDSVS